MKAIVYKNFGGPEVLSLQEINTPSPKENEILIRIKAVPVGFGDLMARNFKSISPKTFFMPALFLIPAKFDIGWSTPKKQVLGSEFSGIVEAVGQDVQRFKPGDAVFGYRGQLFGTYAEYLVMPVDGTVSLKPENMSFEEAAAVPYGALTALNLLKNVQIQAGDKVLINGASGSIGTAAVQFAKMAGAEVTGVCGAPRMDYVRSLGADHVIDYKVVDFATSDKTYDLVLDVLGKSSFSKVKRVLSAKGVYLLASFKLKQLIQMFFTKISGGKRVICALSMERPEDLEHIRELIKMGKYKTVIDQTFPFEKTADAHRYIENGEKKGAVIIRV